MTSANPSLPRPPSYYFKPVKVEPEPTEQDKSNVEQNVKKSNVEQNVKKSHSAPDLFEPSAKRILRSCTPFTSSTPPPTPYLQTSMIDRWLLDPMP